MTRSLLLAMTVLLSSSLTFAGCARDGSVLPASGATTPAVATDATDLVRSWILPEATKGGLVYVSNFDANGMVTIYPQTGRNPQPIGRLCCFKYAAGLFVDSHRNLYVADADDYVVQEYAVGTTSPMRTLRWTAGGAYRPLDVVVAKDGTAYVSFYSSDTKMPGAVAVYKRGANEPTSFLKAVAGFFPVGVTLNAQNQVYVTYDRSASGRSPRLAEFVPGSKNAIPTGIQITHADFPAFDKSQNLVVPNSQTGSFVIFPPHSNKPILTVADGRPSQVAISSANIFFVADYGRGVNVYRYDAEQASVRDLNEITNGLSGLTVDGVAVSPALSN